MIKIICIIVIVICCSSVLGGGAIFLIQNKDMLQTLTKGESKNESGKYLPLHFSADYSQEIVDYIGGDVAKCITACDSNNECIGFTRFNYTADDYCILMKAYNNPKLDKRVTTYTKPGKNYPTQIN